MTNKTGAPRRAALRAVAAATRGEAMTSAPTDTPGEAPGETVVDPAGAPAEAGRKPRTRGSKQRPRRLFGLQAQAEFLEHLSATCNASAAARATGWPTSTVHQRRYRDPAFAEAWRRAIRIAYDRLEEAVLAHALGKVEPVAFDPQAVAIVVTDPDPADAERMRTTRHAAGIGDKMVERVALVDAQLALAILNRRAATERDGRERMPRRKATPDEVATAINRKLDKLAERIGHRL